MAQRIAFFNHKGGVSKTTTAFHVGWMLATKGKKTLVVDTDPQCNLTGLVLGYRGQDDFENFYEEDEGRNLRAGLAPAFESQPRKIEAIDCVGVPGCEGMSLLPGHIRLSEYEVTLGIAQELSGSIQTLKNLPGSFAYLLEETADEVGADYVLIDMNPSLSSINQNLLMTSHYFILPSSPDYFSLMAIDSLSEVLPGWSKWAQEAQALPVLQDATYPFPGVTPKFLGTIIQNYRPRKGAPTVGFQKWIDEINDLVIEKFYPALEDRGMTLSEQKYAEAGVGEDKCLTLIPDFNTLITKAQEEQTPVYALTEEQIGQYGTVLESSVEKRDEFNGIFSDLADRIIALTTDD